MLHQHHYTNSACTDVFYKEITLIAISDSDIDVIKS